MEQYQSLGLDLYQAVLKVDESVGLAPSLETVAQSSAGVPSPADNDKALAELRAMMGGIK